MADGTAVTPGSGQTIATKDAATSGTFVGVASKVQVFEAGTVSSGGVVSARPQTGTTTSVNDTGSSTTLLSASGTRKSFTILNDSTARLYIKYGATASLSDFGYYIEPGDVASEDGYGGRVDGIWASNESGAARITSIE